MKELVLQKANKIFVNEENNYSLSATVEEALYHLSVVWTMKLSGLLSLCTDFEYFSVFKPAAMNENNLNTMLDRLISGETALKAIRKKKDTEWESYPYILYLMVVVRGM